jgi:uncharacterized short protein YbdD (DUF466 family)
MIARLFELLRLMVGVPDYARFVAHRQAHHPELPIPTRADFIAERQQARFGGKSQSRCC